MKTNKLLIMGLILGGLILSSCGKVSPSNDISSEDSVPSMQESIDDLSSSDEEEITYLTVSEAINLANEVGENGTAERQYVMGTVKNITNSNYGEMYITDGTNDLYIYGVYSADGKLHYNELEDKPYTGDEVYLYGYVKTYNGSPEMGASWLQKYISHQGEIDLSDYCNMDIANARNATKGSKVLIQGVVAKITYANGKVPNGIYLVDDHSSIYVYGNELAGRVEVGEEIQVAGTRDDYILDSEVTLAQKWGYQGSIQLANAIFVKSIGKNREYLKSWVLESSMKELLETPFTNNITTEIYKVTAIVNRVPGSGFVNYYINDLDNETGSYVYTLCNGGDFNYLDIVDGKICTVYLALHNAKATASGAYYRLMPIDVKVNESFSMSNDDICNFALNYYAIPQFKKEYNADPELELLTSISNEYIPFENVKLEYSSTSELVTFDNSDDKLVMHLGEGSGEVSISLKATYNGHSASCSYVFQVINVDLPETVTVAEAIAANDNTVVAVRGIVMSSVIVQTAFYINDGTGVIAVRTDSTTIKNIALGNEIVVQGTRTHVKKDGSSNIGQSCIDNAVLLANLMGNHDYDKSTFITDKTFDEILGYSSDQATIDRSTSVFVAECTLTKVASTYYTNYYLSNSNNSSKYLLYASNGATQYGAFDSFVNKLITVTFMLCDWNSKGYYAACIVSATDGETTILNNYNFR